MENDKDIKTNKAEQEYIKLYWNLKNICSIRSNINSQNEVFEIKNVDANADPLKTNSSYMECDFFVSQEVQAIFTATATRFRMG
jgi:hypothetical protein